MKTLLISLKSIWVFYKIFLFYAENMIINDLIREYLEHNNYQHSLAVFGPESNMPEKMLDRQMITKKLKIVEDASSR